MILQDISFSTPAENILFDEVLLYLAEHGRPEEILRLWESPQTFVVLGRTGKISEELNLSTVQQDNVPILRRFSGGGTVVQGRGCLNFSFVLSKERNPRISDLHQSYQYILGEVIAVLQGLGVHAVFKPISDVALAVSDRKISGNAQHRGRKFILHHGTLLCDFDLRMIAKYLAMPKVVPEYRRGRAHSDFVANLGQDVLSVKRAFQTHFELPDVRKQATDEETQVLQDFFQSKVVIAV